jgi:hypothetical protein
MTKASDLPRPPYLFETDWKEMGVWIGFFSDQVGLLERLEGKTGV